MPSLYHSTALSSKTNPYCVGEHPEPPFLMKAPNQLTHTKFLPPLSVPNLKHIVVGPEPPFLMKSSNSLTVIRNKPNELQDPDQ
jgi:hypothetical protein